MILRWTVLVQQLRCVMYVCCQEFMEYVGGSKFQSAHGRCVALHSGYGFHFLCRCCLEAIVVVIFCVLEGMVFL